MDLNVKPKITNILEENIVISLHDLIFLPLGIFPGHSVYLEYSYLQLCVSSCYGNSCSFKRIIFQDANQILSPPHSLNPSR